MVGDGKLGRVESTMRMLAICFSFVDLGLEYKI
jgi:hypothetical protein